MLRFMGSQRVGHDWATALNWTEVSQKEKNKYHIILFICGIQKNDTNKLIYETESQTENRLVIVEGEGEEEGIASLYTRK